MQSGRLLVSGADFYCGNSSGSPCQLALKNQIPSQYIHPATKQCNYSIDTSQFALKNELPNISTLNNARYAVRRDVKGSILFTDAVGVGNVKVSYRGIPAKSKTFKFTYKSEYPVWYLRISSTGGGGTAGSGSHTFKCDINGKPFEFAGYSFSFSSGIIEFSGETEFTITIKSTYSGTADNSIFELGNTTIQVSHNYY